MALALTSRRRTLAAAASALAAIALAVGVVGRGCRVGAPGPDAAVRALIQAARAGDRQAVYDLLSPATQGRLAERARKATALVGASVRYAPLDLISIGAFGDAPAPSDLDVVEDTGERATVEIETSGGTARLGLVRVDGHWRVDLPGYGTDL